MQSLKTPSPREKAPAEVVSAPKTTKKEEVHVTRSPTQYYSPSKGERSKNGKKVPKVPEAKTTAVKRSAKPPKKTIDKKTPTQTDDQQKEPKTIDKKKKNQTEDQQDTTPPKQETVPTAIAVHATLQRAATVDINSGPPPPSPGGSDNDESGSASDSDGGGDQNEDNDDQEGPEGPGEDGLTAEHVRQKKLAHARYMRFSRSLQSTSAAICMIYIHLCVRVHVHTAQQIFSKHAGYDFKHEHVHTSHVAKSAAVFNHGAINKIYYNCMCISVVKELLEKIHVHLLRTGYHEYVDRQSIRIVQVADALLKSSALGRQRSAATGFM